MPHRCHPWARSCRSCIVDNVDPFAHNALMLAPGSYVTVNEIKVKVDLTKYTEQHQFNFDVALDDTVSNGAQAQVSPLDIGCRLLISICLF